MKRFRFRLETLLELKKRAEDDVKQRLAEANREIMTARTELASIYDELKELQTGELKRRGRNADVMMLRYSVAYRHKLKTDLLAKGKQIDDLSARAFKIQQELVTARKERRAIEIVRERRLGEWKKEYRTREQEFIDDVSQQGYIRRRMDEVKK